MKTHISKLIIYLFTLSLLINAFTLSFFFSFSTLVPMSEYNASVVDKPVTKYVFEKIKHVLYILVESGILAIEDYEECMDVLFFF